MNSLVLPSRVSINEADQFKVTAALGRRPETWDLVSKQGLTDLIVTLETASVPCGKDKGTELGKMLLGTYPMHNVGDVAMYSRGISSIIAEYPVQIAARAIDLVTRESKYLPTRADIDQHCKKMLNELKASIYIANRMIEEHKRREDEAARIAERTREREEFRKKHGEKSPMDVLRDEGIKPGGKTETAVQQKKRRRDEKAEAASRRNR